VTQTEARRLARRIRVDAPGAVAIATQESRYRGAFPKGDEPWIVVANGTLIRSSEDLAGPRESY
jgi:hypothetical protein